MADDLLEDAFRTRFKLIPLEREWEKAEGRIAPTPAVPMDEDPESEFEGQKAAVRTFLQKLEAYNADVPQRYSIDSEESSTSDFADVDLWALLSDIRGRMRYTVNNITRDIINEYGENELGYTAVGLPKVSEVLGIVLQPPHYTAQLKVLFNFGKGAQTRTLDLKYFSRDDGHVRVFLNNYWFQHDLFESNFRNAIWLFFNPPTKGDISCKMCGNPASKECSRCAAVDYCSKECQKIDWLRGHNKLCEV